MNKTNQGFQKKVILKYDNFAGFPTQGTANNLYYDSATGTMYYWNGTSYVPWGGEFNETITNITNITDGFSYTNESGVTKNVTQKLDNTDPNNQKIQTLIDGVVVFEFPLYTVNNDIQINNAGSEWDLTDDKITILETNGDSQQIIFPYRVTMVVNPNGSIDVKQNGVTIGTIPAPTPDTAYSKMLFIDPTNGNDTTGTGSDNKMFKTIAKALTVANGSGYRIVLGAGTYNEDIIINHQNIDIVTVAGATRGNTFINGTVTFTHPASSSGIHGISMNNLIHSGAGSLYVKDCDVKTATTKTGTGYLEITNSDIKGVSITGTGQSVFIGGKQAGFTVNNANAIVSVKGSNNLAVATVTAGTLGVLDSIGFGATANGKAITSSAGTMIVIANSQFYGSTGLITGLTLNGFYGIDDVQFDKINSTLGTNLGTIGWFDKVGIINPATITTATKMLVRDANGVVSEQVFPTGLPTGGTDGQVLTVQPDGSYAWEALPAGSVAPTITFGTTAPTGTPPAGSEYFITSDGTSTGTITQEWIYTGTAWVKRPSTSTETAPSLPVAVAIGTQSQLDALTDKITDGYYIVTDGANKGDILQWIDIDDDGIGDVWELHLVPTNQLEWNVLTNATGEPAGRYTYNITTDTWTKTEEIEPLVPSVDDPTAVGGIKMIGRYLAPLSENGSAFILGDSVAGQGRFISHAIDNGSIIAPAANIPMVQKSPFTYYQVDTPYSTLSQRDAWAVDCQFNSAGAVAIDDLGILYYKGTAAFVSGMTGTDSGVSTAITSAFVPDKFWANRAVKVFKYWLSYNTNNIIALAGDGTIWTKGVAGASGIYGDGTVVVNNLWHKVNIPQKSYKKVYITYDGLACGALGSDGKMYVWGTNTTRRIAPIATTPITTPYEITSPTAVTDFAMDTNSTMLVSAGARWAIGTNTSGKFGNGNTTALTTYTLLPQNGFTFDKVFSFDDSVNNAYYYITTDKKAVHTGYNDLQFATSVAAANVLTPTLMGNGTYQGTVIDVRAYYQSVLIHTNQGEVWTAVNQGGSNGGQHGWGINIVTGTAGLNTFKKVPVPSLVVGVQSSQSSNYQCQYTVLTDRGLIYTWGAAVFQYGVAEINYAPSEIPTQMFRQQNPKSNTVVDLLSLTASLTTIANGTASGINDGTNNQTVTFNIPYTGTAGVLDTSAWSITGGDVTVSNIQNPIYVIANSGTLSFTAVVNAADIPSLVIPNTQPQTYTLNTGALTATATGTRGTDAILGGLTTSASAYNSAANGTWVAITEAEYTAIQTSVGSVFKAGQVDSPTLYTTAGDWGDLGIGFSATTTPTAETANVTKAIPNGSWLYAYQFKTGAATTNRTNYLSLGTKGGTTGFATVLPAITGVTNTALQLKQYVYKGGLFVPTTKDIASLGGSVGYGSIANHQSFYSGSGAPSTTVFGSNWGTSAQFQQVLTTPTKQW